MRVTDLGFGAADETAGVQKTEDQSLSKTTIPRSDKNETKTATDDLEIDSKASPVVDDDASDDIDDDGNEGSDSVNLLNRSYSPRNSETDNFRLYLNDMGQYKVLS